MITEVPIPHKKNTKIKTGYYNPELVAYNRDILTKSSGELDDLFAQQIDDSGLTYKEKTYIADAYELMQQGHEGQIRNHSGKPYEVHPKGAALAYIFHKKQLGQEINPLSIRTLLLHDVVEDTHHTDLHIRQCQGDLVADSVAALTKPVDEEGKSVGEEASIQKLKRAIDAGNSIVKEVKVYERINNILDRPDVTRPSHFSKKYDNADYKSAQKTIKKTKKHLLKEILHGKNNRIFREIIFDVIKASEEDIKQQTKSAQNKAA